MAESCSVSFNCFGLRDRAQLSSEVCDKAAEHGDILMNLIKKKTFHSRLLSFSCGNGISEFARAVLVLDPYVQLINNRNNI